MSFWSELKRRNVFKVGAAYLIAGWLILQVASITFPALNLPSWALTFLTVFLIIGLIVAIILAWAYEVTPDGVKPTKEVPLVESITQVTGRKLNYIVTGLLIIAIAYILFDHFYLDRRIAGPEPAATVAEQAPDTSAPAESPKTIAVLPFDDLSPEKDQGYFADGLAEELINKLAQVKNLQVTARTSSFNYKDKNVDMRTIGEELGVTNLLEGSVRKSGNQVRITAQLIKAVDGYHLWSNNYDRELKDIFTIQDDIADGVTTALSVTLGVGEFSRPGMTRNIEAYDLYLRATSNLLKYSPDSILTAIDQFKEALDIDPNFGLGWVLLNITYNNGAALLKPEQAVDFKARAVEALERAWAIAPEMPELLMFTTEELQNSGKWLEADRIFKQILDEQGHSNSDANREYALMLLRAGRSSDALQYLQRGKRLNPFESLLSFYLSAALFNSGRTDEALIEAKRGQALEGLDNMFDMVEFLVELDGNDRSRAAAVIRTSYGPGGNYPDETMLRLADILLMEDTEAALSELKKISKSSDIPPITRNYIDCIACQLGNVELAFESLREAKSNIDGLLPIWDHMHSAIRKLPAFKTYIHKIGLYDYWRDSGEWADSCRPVGDDDFECD